MKSNLNILTIAALCVLFTGCNNKPEKPLDSAPPIANSEVTVTEMEPDDQFYKAIKAMIKGEHLQSAGYIREAAKSMRLIANSASQEHKFRIENAAEGLEALANKVANTRVKDITNLYTSFGKAGRALAQYRLNVTEKEYFSHTESKSGASLKRVIDQLEKSISTRRRTLNPEERATLNDALEIAAQLQKGGKVDEEDLRNTLQKVEDEIEKWDREFKTM
jgi:hypothetical protein